MARSSSAPIENIIIIIYVVNVAIYMYENHLYLVPSEKHMLGFRVGFSRQVSPIRPTGIFTKRDAKAVLFLVEFFSL